MATPGVPQLAFGKEREIGIVDTEGKVLAVLVEREYLGLWVSGAALEDGLCDGVAVCRELAVLVRGRVRQLQ
jgi:hypothetical protein